MSRVTYHVSHVTCHVSHVMCHMSQLLLLLYIFFKQSVEVYRWRVCYQRGLPRLVLYLLVARLSLLLALTWFGLLISMLIWELAK